MTRRPHALLLLCALCIGIHTYTALATRVEDTVAYAAQGEEESRAFLRYSLEEEAIATSPSWLKWLKNILHWRGADDKESSNGGQTLVHQAYNESKAVYLAYVTSVAYCQAPHIKDWSCSPCSLVQPLEGIRIVEDKKDNFQGIVGYSKEQNAVLVAFRGSMDVKNWIDNLTFVKKKAYPKYPNVLVHSGFFWVYMSVAEQVVPAVQELLKQHENASVIVTGHSLGGAVAALCSFDLALLHEMPVQALYTFGEPRVGNGNFSVVLNAAVPDVYRVTHFRDVVPHLPPSWIGFKHTTQEVFYDEYSSAYRVCDPVNGEDPECADSCSPFGCTSIVDHLMYLNVTMSHLIC
ncbi:hypothetical protein Poli38472_008399 [Pythium oligandrum]|uniref:Fungal lipase-type domain-containing protein n=1 Tax=Pythium oligandrum TaxID=41045 RepID=A0A8K1CNP3_PYTOL|nr:hypothetical protein Poli38472_008399 [Pythium oligandrum]|eukprot:TMW65757.1 hypothetical protein Poli38472_008399 [Pythium oligandrum]